MNSLKTDVIVIGCGPGGAQTARNLSRKGFSVALLDYRLNVGDKLCTGIVGTEMLNQYSIDQTIRGELTVEKLQTAKSWYNNE